MQENNPTQKNITWPFWIQVPVAAALPLVLVWCFSTSYEDTGWLYQFFHNVVGPLSSIQMLLCLPVGIIGLIMARRMKRLRTATTILATINVLEAALFIAYFILLFVIIGSVR